MEITFLGMGFDACCLMQQLEASIPGHYVAISSQAADLEQYDGDTIRYICRPSVEAAALRILTKTKKHTKNSDIVFLLSAITGKHNENIICHLTEGLTDQIVVSIVWYPKHKHGQQGIENTVDRLGACSSVIAIPDDRLPALLTYVPEYAEQVLRMYALPYVNAEPETGKRILSDGGLLHLVREEIGYFSLNPRNARSPFGISEINYSRTLDTQLEYCSSALLHLTVPPATPPRIIQFVCDYLYSRLGEDGDFNFSLSVDSTLKNAVIIELLATDSVTTAQSEMWL